MHAEYVRHQTKGVRKNVVKLLALRYYRKKVCFESPKRKFPSGSVLPAKLQFTYTKRKYIHIISIQV